jgi:RNA polymerase sigma-70 factor, ECF subfamily
VTRRGEGDRREGIGANREATGGFIGLFGDEAAFRSWYDAALPRVYAYLFDRCGGQASLAQELTQETFVHAVRSRQEFEARSDPVTWLCGIARHKLADHYRRQGRESRRFLRLVTRHLERDAEDVPEESDRRSFVLQTLRRLPDMQRLVLILHYMDALSSREIAQLLGRSESAVESLLVRGREGFRRLYRAQGDEDV